MLPDVAEGMKVLLGPPHSSPLPRSPGAGYIAAMLGMVAAAVVEIVRLDVVARHGLQVGCKPHSISPVRLLRVLGSRKGCWWLLAGRPSLSHGACSSRGQPLAASLASSSFGTTGPRFPNNVPEQDTDPTADGAPLVPMSVWWQAIQVGGPAGQAGRALPQPGSRCLACAAAMSTQLPAAMSTRLPLAAVTKPLCCICIDFDLPSLPRSTCASA